VRLASEDGVFAFCRFADDAMSGVDGRRELSISTGTAETGDVLVAIKDMGSGASARFLSITACQESASG
jgi:hypothetical protein